MSNFKRKLDRKQLKNKSAKSEETLTFDSNPIPEFKKPTLDDFRKAFREFKKSIRESKLSPQQTGQNLIRQAIGRKFGQ